MRFCSFILFLVCCLIFGCSSKVNVIDNKSNSSRNYQIQKIYFAGFAISGDSAAGSHNFPYATALMKEINQNGMSDLDVEAQNAIKTVRNSYIDIQPSEKMGDYKDYSNAFSAAVVLDSEDVTQEKIDGNIKLVVTLRGQVIIFNFKDKKVVASYPITAESIHASKTSMTNDEILSVVKGLYVGKGESFVKKLVERLNTIAVNSEITRGIQVKDVRFENETDKQILRPGQNINDVRTLMARNFEKYLSNNQNVSVIPFYQDASIIGKRSLATRFSNGDILNLELPSPDYTVSLSLKKLKKARVGGNAVEDVIGYASIINIKAEQPEMMKTYIDADVRYALPVMQTKSMTEIDDRSHYLESSIQVMNNFTKQLSEPDSEWLDTWVDSKENSLEQFNSFYEVVKKCR